MLNSKLDAIENGIYNFKNLDFTDCCIDLLELLNYPIDHDSIYQYNKIDEFLVESGLSRNELTENEMNILDEINELSILVQLTNELSELKNIKEYDQDLFAIYSILFFGIDLNVNKYNKYNKYELSSLTSLMNKFFSSPVVLLIKYGESIYFGTTIRRKNKIDLFKDIAGSSFISNEYKIGDLTESNLYNILKIDFDCLEKENFYDMYIDLINKISKNKYAIHKNNEEINAHDKLKDSIGHYLEVIGAYDVLSPEEEIKIFKMYSNSYGQKKLEIRDFLILHNLKLVVNIATSYMHSFKKYIHSNTLEDLIEYGNLGLIKAIDQFDYKKGYKFSTFSTHYIKRYIQRNLKNHDLLVRVPIHAEDEYLKINQKLRSGNGFEEAFKETSYDLIFYEKIKKLHEDYLPIDEMLLDDEIFMDEHCIEDDVIEELACQEIRFYLEYLNKRERDIITLRFGLEDGRTRTLEEIGKKFDVTRERIRQIEKKALKKLKFKMTHEQADMIEKIEKYYRICDEKKKPKKESEKVEFVKSIKPEFPKKESDSKIRIFEHLDYSYQLKGKSHVIRHYKNWNLELNYVKWGDKDFQFDLRRWSPDHKKMSKGILLSKEEIKKLKKVLRDLGKET